MTQNIAKNIVGNVALSYQVTLAIETENYINSHVFTCRHWVSICNAYLNIRHVVGKFFDWPDIFLMGRGKIGMELAIR